ncbi:MAG: hypothetical protein ACR2HQ_12910 [Ilumatobacteraceae bacterium]
MTTPAQAAARAANGRLHSTGPKTPAGKLVSSENAVRHGGYARTPVISRGPLKERPEDYEEHLESIHSALQTQGAVQRALGDMVASLTWRLRRTHTFEADYLGVPHGDVASQVELLRLKHEQSYIAARVLRDPAGEYSADELELAAVEAGHAARVDMGDSWPQPRPQTQTEWHALIDQTLTRAGIARDRVADDCARVAERLGAEWTSWQNAARESETVRIVDENVLLKMSRVESHLGKELSRCLGLLRSLQDAKASMAEDA